MAIIFQVNAIIHYHDIQLITQSMKKFTNTNIQGEGIDMILEYGSSEILGITELFVVLLLIDVIIYIMQIIYLIQYRKYTKLIIKEYILYNTIGYEMNIEYDDIDTIYDKKSLFYNIKRIKIKKAVLIITSKIPWWIRIFQNLQSSEILLNGFNDEVISEIEKHMKNNIYAQQVAAGDMAKA